ncbi:MAG TPA: hypothetical protein VE177_00400, partial [Candidatus Binatus sp.]|nr:hypothetical protein [Candidatus Binatus sp.]
MNPKDSTGKKLLKLIDPILDEYGLVLESDPRLPSIVGTLIGEPPHSSWWSHPKGRTIYQLLNVFTSRPDILMTKLLSAKTTFIHQT